MRIKKVSLKNFKQFRQFQMTCDDELNILIGDNETGKSTILEAIDLVLRGSVYAVESVGLENLFNDQVIEEYLKGAKLLKDLPELRVEITFDETLCAEINGKDNTSGEEANGVKLVCQCDDGYSETVSKLLKEPKAVFPFEFYSIRFTKFRGGASYSGSEKLVRHLLIDTSRISQANANQTYVRSMFESVTSRQDRANLSAHYREMKAAFNTDVLGPLNVKLDGRDALKVRSDSKTNLESDLTIYRDDIPIFNRGKGMQNIIKVQFGLTKGDYPSKIVLLEEPENHLGYRLMQEQIDTIRKEPKVNQLFLTTHSSRITSRLGLNHCRMLTAGLSVPAYFDSLPDPTAKYFMKAPDNKALEFLLSPKVILVEGHAEYILMEKLYAAATGGSLHGDKIHVIAIGGKHFAHYMELAKIVGNRVAVLMDNDGNHAEKCATRFADYSIATLCMFYEKDNSLREFEYCLEHVNKKLCADTFGKNGAVPLSFMLNNKTSAAMALLTSDCAVECPGYIKEAITWVKSST